jgi:hypothetical protein
MVRQNFTTCGLRRTRIIAGEEIRSEASRVFRVVLSISPMERMGPNPAFGLLVLAIASEIFSRPLMFGLRSIGGQWMKAAETS